MFKQREPELTLTVTKKNNNVKGIRLPENYEQAKGYDYDVYSLEELTIPGNGEAICKVGIDVQWNGDYIAIVSQKERRYLTNVVAVPVVYTYNIKDFSVKLRNTFVSPAKILSGETIASLTFFKLSPLLPYKIEFTG
jgi:hypothetical protein